VDFALLVSKEETVSEDGQKNGRVAHIGWADCALRLKAPASRPGRRRAGARTVFSQACENRTRNDL
jgi:hypothetical protein